VSLRGAKRRSNLEEFARYYHTLRDRDNNKASNTLRLHMEEKNQKEKIAAVVVTYNRKDLLKECLDALFNQTRPLDSIILIDNASTDGTLEFLKEKGYLDNSKLDYVRLPENTGGAGGFHEGVKRGYEKGYDWLWLMDDDTISEKNSLEYLLEIAFLNLNINIGFLCSKVLWTDETPHKMNLPQINPFVNKIPFNIFEGYEILLVNSCSFVSVLIKKDIIKEVGLPIKDFFIWADDVDFSLRIKREREKVYYISDAKIIRMRQSTQESPFKIGRAHFLIRNLTYIDLKYGNFFVKLLRPIINNGRFLLGRIYRKDFKNCKIVIFYFWNGIKMYLEKYNYFI